MFCLEDGYLVFLVMSWLFFIDICHVVMVREAVHGCPIIYDMQGATITSVDSVFSLHIKRISEIVVYKLYQIPDKA